MCPTCGARNNTDQTQCWQCRAALQVQEASIHVTPRPMHRSADQAGLDPRRSERILIAASLITMIVALALTLRLVQLAIHPHSLPASSLRDVFDQYLVPTRVITGVVVILGWPLALHLTARLMRLSFPRPSYFLTLLGVLIGGIAYNTTFLPWPALATAPLVPAVVSLALIPWFLSIAWKRGIILWAIHGTLMAGITAGCVWGLESAASGQMLNPLTELPIIYQFGHQEPTKPQKLWPNPSRPALPTFSWPATGSTWLDHRANRVKISVQNNERTDNWTVELVVDGVKVQEQPSKYYSNPWHSPHFVPQTDAVYRIIIGPEMRPGDTADVRGLLPLQRTDAPASL